MNGRFGYALPVVLAGAVMLQGCGIGIKDAGKSKAGLLAAVAPAPVVSRQQALQQAAIARRLAALPAQTPGVVTVATEHELGVTPAVASGFAAASGLSVALRSPSPSIAFRELCDGEVDIVESDLPASMSDVDGCAGNGLSILQGSNGQPLGIELAADGIVLATRNGSDVGGDCITSATARQLFEAGSALTNWSQIGFDPIPIVTAGRGSGSTLQMFGSLVLGGTGTTGLADLRSDFVAGATDTAVRNLVTGADHTAGDPDGAVGFFPFSYYELYAEQLRPLEIWDQVTEQATLEQSGIATSATRIQDVTRSSTELRAGGQVTPVTTSTFEATPTTAGSSYISTSGEAVTVPTGGPVNIAVQPDCVFPSQDTVAGGSYPFSVRLLAYTTTRALAQADVRDYLGYYLDRGQAIVADRRLLPVPNQLRAQEYQLVTGKSLNIGGSGTPATATPATRAGGVPSPLATTSPSVPGVGSAGAG